MNNHPYFVSSNILQDNLHSIDNKKAQQRIFIKETHYDSIQS